MERTEEQKDGGKEELRKEGRDQKYLLEYALPSNKRLT